MFGLTKADAFHLGRACCAGAGVIHAAAIPSHLKEYWAFPVFFGVSAGAQIIWAFYVLRKISARLLLVGAAGNLAIVGVWVISRTVGVPIGPDPEVEAVGLADVIATLQELVVVFASMYLVRFKIALPSLPKTRATEPAIILMTLVLGATMGGVYLDLLH